jgi:hypothetical protein
MYNAYNCTDVLSIRPELAIDTEMLGRVFVGVRYGDIALATARLDNESAALARGFL